MTNKEYVELLIEKSGLISFNEEEHIYSKDGHEYISATTLIREIFPDPKFEELMNDPVIREKIDAKAIVGTNIHKAIENFYLTNEHPRELGKREYYYYQNFQRLIRSPWYESMKFLATEQIVFNEEFKIAGTIDLIFENPEGKIILCDFKTSSSERNSYWFQGFMYSWLVKESLNLDYFPEVFFIYLKLYPENNLRVVQAQFDQIEDFKVVFENWKNSIRSKKEN